MSTSQLTKTRYDAYSGLAMNTITPQVVFASAYRQLKHEERAFVDAVVSELEHAAHRSGDRVSLALNKPLPSEIVERSNGFLERPMVTAAITERINEIAAKQELTVHRMVREMMAVSFSNLGDYMSHDEYGNPVFDLTKCTPEQLAAIKTVDIEEVGDGISVPLKRKVKLTLHDKLGGMKMLGQYMGILEPDNPHWNADIARTKARSVSKEATTREAADEYAKMIGD